MDLEAELHIDLFNFEDEKYEGSKYILTSPRSLEACSRLGIKPVELLPKHISDFKEEYIPQGLPMRTISSMHREYERERLNKLQLCIEARREVVKEEFEEHQLDDALDNLHLCVHSDKTSSVNSSEAFSGESGDESGIERARTASSLSVRGFAADELDQRLTRLCQNDTKKSRSDAGQRIKKFTRRHSSRLSSRSSSRNRDGLVVKPIRRCQSDLGYVSQETSNSDFSASFRRPRVGRRKKLAAGICTLNHMPRLNKMVDCPGKLRAKDQKILSIMAAKRADQVNQDKKAEKARRQWEAERNQQMKTAQEHELQRRQSLVWRRQKQEQHRLEQLAKREHVEEMMKNSKQQIVDRTMQLSAVAAEKQHLAHLQKQDQLQKQESEKLETVRSRLQQHSADDTEYRKGHASWQQHKMKLASDKRTAAEHQRVMKMQLNNKLSRRKHELKYDALKHQWIDDQINLRASVESKLQQTERMSELQQQRHRLAIQKRQRDLDKKIERSRLKQQQMEQAMAVWCDKLTNYRKIQATYSEHVAKEAVARKSQAAYSLRSQNKKLQQENIRKIAEREKQWEAELKEALERKDRRIKAARSEREKMVTESRALAEASQRMRDKLKAVYSVNDLDQLSKQAAAENKLLFKQRRYVSRYNPGTASTITLG